INTICLYLAYGIPILLHLRNRLPRQETPWTLGRFSPFVNVVAIVWIAIITVVFMLPPNELVLWTMLFVAVALTAYWFFSARQRFRGPTASPSLSTDRNS